MTKCVSWREGMLRLFFHNTPFTLLGDGTFGVSPRTVDDERRWYEEVATATPHFWIVDAGPDEVKFSAMNQMGKIFDSVTLD